MRNQDEIDLACKDIYRETKVFYQKMLSLAQEQTDTGYQILMGPPFQKAPIMFIGLQPGKGCKTPAQEREYGSEDRWPERSEYITECWPLARRLREIFPLAVLEKSVGINAIFFRANTYSDYVRQFDSARRREIGDFCRQRLLKLIDLIQPKRVVAIGLATLDIFCPSLPDEVNGRGRVLTRSGAFRAGQNACRALSVLHLTGARISRPDRCKIRAQLRKFCEID